MLFLFFFNDTPTTEIYTLSLHDALPICDGARVFGIDVDAAGRERIEHDRRVAQSLAMRRRRLAGALCGLLEYLAQDVRLGEALGSDIKRRRRDRRSGNDERNEAGERVR